MSLEVKPKPAATYNHDQFDVSAEGLGRYTIDVSLPIGYQSSGAKYPVILATDGNLLFDLAQVQVHGRGTRMGSLIPPSIVVGVGYPDDEGLASFYSRRNHDFHGPWAMTDPLGQTLQGIFTMLKTADGKPGMTMRAGGYDRFMGFLRDELLPALAGRYPIDLAARHTLIGDSSGGHLVLRALHDPTSPFRRYVCISPGFASAEGSIEAAEAEYAKHHTDLDVDLFICCGRVEVGADPVTAQCRFGRGVTWAVEQFAIRQWPSARIDWEIMNNEDHASIPARGISAGIRSVHRIRPGVHTEELQAAAGALMERMKQQKT